MLIITKFIISIPSRKVYYETGGKTGDGSSFHPEMEHGDGSISGWNEEPSIYR